MASRDENDDVSFSTSSGLGILCISIACSVIVSKFVVNIEVDDVVCFRDSRYRTKANKFKNGNGQDKNSEYCNVRRSTAKLASLVSAGTSLRSRYPGMIPTTIAGAEKPTHDDSKETTIAHCGGPGKVQNLGGALKKPCNFLPLSKTAR
jgi:hypothetical protein